MVAASDAWPIGAGGWPDQPADPDDPPPEPPPEEPDSALPDGYEPI